MREDPKCAQRYDEYEPEKYDCIAVDDELVESIDPLWCELEFYWHTRSVPGKGLAYCGITLIPPEVLDACISAIVGMEGVAPLRRLLEQAMVEHKYVIHFGL